MGPRSSEIACRRSVKEPEDKKATISELEKTIQEKEREIEYVKEKWREERRNAEMFANKVRELEEKIRLRTQDLDLSCKEKREDPRVEETNKARIFQNRGKNEILFILF